MAFLRGLSADRTDHPLPGERQVVSEHEELDKLDQLHADGMLTDAERDHAKAQLEQRTEPEASGQLEDIRQPADVAEVGDVVDPEAAEPADRPVRRRRQLPLWAMIAWPVALAAAGIGLIVWALTSGGSGSSGTPVNGLIAVVDHQSVAPDEVVSLDTQFGTGGYAVGKPCHTLTGYPDIVTGSPVVITDGSGKTLARTKLRPGVFDVNADCVFGFVTSVKASDTYQIKVGQRDPVNYPAAAITHPQLSLGG